MTRSFLWHDLRVCTWRVWNESLESIIFPPPLSSNKSLPLTLLLPCRWALLWCVHVAVFPAFTPNRGVSSELGTKYPMYAVAFFLHANVIWGNVRRFLFVSFACCFAFCLVGWLVLFLVEVALAYKFHSYKPGISPQWYLELRGRWASVPCPFAWDLACRTMPVQ